MKKLIIGIILFLSMVTIVTAVQPSQSTNKLLLTPFYISSMTQNIQYNYSVNVVVPDGISEVRTAILTLDAWVNPTRTFNAWMNNIQCNTKNYTVSTTYASAGRGVITFDCTNAIISNQLNSVRFVVAGGNIGASTAWLDLTYMNNPIGELDIMGTEYSPNDPATMFVQLKNSQGIPIHNGSCYLDIWYPLTNGTHPYTVQDTPMLQALGDDGIYYYDMIAPSTLGVYMLSARCSYSYNWIWFFPESESQFYPIEEIISGNWQGGGSPQALNSKSDGLYERCDGTIASPCSANYTFNTSVYGMNPNVSNINIYFSGQTDTAGRTLSMAYWNGSTFVNLTNTLTFSGTGGTAPTPYEQFLTNSIPLNAMINNTIKVKLLTSGSVRVFQNWLSIVLLSSEGTILDVKGSSEMHITNIPNATVTLVNNQTPAYVWNYTNRTLTDYHEQSIATYVWNNTVRNLTYYQDVANYTLINQGVWNYNNRTLTDYGINLIADAVWQYSGNVTSTLLGQFSDSIWNYVARYVHGILI